MGGEHLTERSSAVGLSCGQSLIDQEWVASFGLDTAKLGARSLRRTQVVLFNGRTSNLGVG
jgi:hypothetical protein